MIARERGIVHRVWGPGTDHLNLGSTQKSMYLAELGDTPPLIAGLETAPPRATPYQTLFPSIPGKWPRLPSSSSSGHLQTRTKADLRAFLPRAGLESALCSSGSFSLSSLRQTSVLVLQSLQRCPLSHHHLRPVLIPLPPLLSVHTTQSERLDSSRFYQFPCLLFLGLRWTGWDVSSSALLALDGCGATEWHQTLVSLCSEGASNSQGSVSF